MKKLIKVTKKHIRRGMRESKDSCPIALAMKEAGAFPELEVTNFMAFWRGRHSDLPRSARRFVKTFDAGRPVKAFNFYLTPEGRG